MKRTRMSESKNFFRYREEYKVGGVSVKRIYDEYEKYVYTETMEFTETTFFGQLSFTTRIEMRMYGTLTVKKVDNKIAVHNDGVHLYDVEILGHIGVIYKNFNSLLNNIRGEK